MDQNTVLVVVALVALVIVGIVVFRRSRSFKAHVKGPGGMEAGVEASDPLPQQPTGAVIEDSKSRSGGAHAEDHTGAGAAIRGTEVERDLRAVSTPTLPKADDAKKG